MTEADDHLFCLITMNHHPLHLNDVYAAESQQGQNVVVGPLVYSLALGMSVSDVSGKAIANLATEELSHPNPVFHGDTLYCESEVLEVRRLEVEARPRDRQGPHPRLQAGQHARRRVQAHGADPAQDARRGRRPRGRGRVAGATANVTLASIVDVNVPLDQLRSFAVMSSAEQLADPSLESGFAAALERHRRELQVHCYRMLGSFEEAEDLVQETFLRAWRKRASFHGGSFRAWLYRIATNACLDVLRRRPSRVTPPEVAAAGDPAVPPAPPADLPWLQPYPDRLLEPIAASEEEPGEVVVARETIELAFLAAIQHCHRDSGPC